MRAWLTIGLLLLATSAWGQAEVRVCSTTPGVGNIPTCLVPNSDGSLDVGAQPITPVVSGSAEATHVLKATAGTLFSVYAVNLTATPGYLTVNNTTAAPSVGAITPLDCAPLPANGSAQVNFTGGPGSTYSTGISVVLTAAATCFTYTAGITGFISGKVQ